MFRIITTIFIKRKWLFSHCCDNETGTGKLSPSLYGNFTLQNNRYPSVTEENTITTIILLNILLQIIYFFYINSDRDLLLLTE